MIDLRDQGDFTEAKKVIETSKSELTDSEQQCLQACYLITCGRFTKALAVLNSIPIEHDDTFHYYDYLMMRGQAAWCQDKIQIAVDDLDLLLEKIQHSNLDETTVIRLKARAHYLKAAICVNLGRANFRVGLDLNTDDIDLPIAHAQKSQRLYESIHDERGMTEAGTVLAFAIRIAGEIEKGLTILGESLEYYQQTGYKLKAAELREYVGSYLFMEFKEYDQIRKQFIDALNVWEQLNYDHGIARSHEKLADYYADLLDLNNARLHYDKSNEMYSTLDNQNAASWVRFNYAQLLNWKGKFEEARSILEDEVLPAFEKHGNKKGTAVTLTRLGSCYLNLGDVDTGKRLQEESFRLADEFDYYVSAKVYAKHNLAFLSRLEGDHDSAVQTFHELIEILPKIGYRFNVAQSLLDLGETHRRNAEYQSALGLYDRGLAITQNYEKVLWIAFQDVIICYYYVIVAAEKFPNIDLEPYIEIVNDIRPDVPSWVHAVAKATEAIYLARRGKRLKDRYRAQTILEQLVKEGTLLNYAIGFIPEFTLLELHIDEFKASGEQIVLDEITTLLQSIQERAAKLQTETVVIDVLIIKSRLVKITGEFDQARSILQDAITRARDYNLPQKIEDITSELDILDETFKTYTKWVEDNLSMKERVSKLKIVDYIDMARNEMLSQ